MVVVEPLEVLVVLAQITVVWLVDLVVEQLKVEVAAQEILHQQAHLKEIMVVLLTSLQVKLEGAEVVLLLLVELCRDQVRVTQVAVMAEMDRLLLLLEPLLFMPVVAEEAHRLVPEFRESAVLVVAQMPLLLEIMVWPVLQIPEVAEVALKIIDPAAQAAAVLSSSSI
jgi:hypothetical protein